ncbi:MAG: RNA polymerase sigma factor [Bacteroidota bacterium]
MVSQTDEKELIYNIQNGSDSAFEHLYAKFYPKMCSFAYMYLHSRDEAEDLVQNIFIKLWESRDSLYITNIQNYLIRATKNACINSINYKQIHARHHEKIALEIAQTELASISTDSDKSISSQTIHQCIDELPTKTKQVIQLKYLQELSASEISEITQTSKRTVETQIYNGIKSLFTIMKEKNILFITICSLIIRNFL